MNRYAWVAASLVGFFLTGFLVVEALEIPLLTEPDDSLREDRAPEALLALGLLVADAFVPVASSVVMVALGSLFGAPAGIALALLGRTAMAMLGFAVGRRGGPRLERALDRSEAERARALVERRGALAIVLSRPVPLLAETVTILAGASGMSWRRAAIAAAVGSLPEAVAYGLAGAASASFEEGAVVWLLFLAVAGTFWAVERRVRTIPAGSSGPP